ncbi:MAG: nuclear transport factor 2 family protein [Flavobacteriaceae bacterium]
MKKIILNTFALFFSLYGLSQTQSKSNLEQIKETLMHYMEGTANGEPNRLKIAFHPDFNLYSVDKDNKLKITSGKKYIEGIKPGRKSNRIGKIISIDLENNTATAKLEINIPKWRVFTDYMLLVKYKGAWKIIHKSYTWKSH